MKLFQSRNVDWKKFGAWMSEDFLDSSLKILGGQGHTPNLVNFFPSTMWKGNSLGVKLLLEEIRVWLGQKVTLNLLQ